MEENKMIGRNLSSILSVGQEIGLNLGGSDSLLFNLCSALDKIVLPLQHLGYRVEKDEERKEERVVLYDASRKFSPYRYQHRDIRRAIANAFDQRRKVKVGGTFSLPKARLQENAMGFVFPVDYEIERLTKNTVKITGSIRYSEYTQTLRDEC
ncbi:hypothetical protein HZA33_01930 [Candidatus Pacearchaeota archaeon]|nr:hypothetical protein [Candidatus Pacearchaeota archaeon]